MSDIDELKELFHETKIPDPLTAALLACAAKLLQEKLELVPLERIQRFNELQAAREEANAAWHEVHVLVMRGEPLEAAAERARVCQRKLMRAKLRLHGWRVGPAPKA